MFNQRAIFRMAYSICRVEGNYIKSIDNMIKVFFHEAMRQFADIILMKHDLGWFIKELTSVCKKHFTASTEDVVLVVKDELKESASMNKSASNKDYSEFASDGFSSDTPEELLNLAKNAYISDTNFIVKEPLKISFSVLNEEMEGFYMEVNDIKNVRTMADNWLEKYNEVMDQKLSLYFYEEFLKNLVKVLRGIGIPDGHMIIVGIRGYAITRLLKLASFVAGCDHTKLVMNENFVENDWLNELKEI